MIKLDDEYSIYRDNNDPGYPGGKAISVSAGNKTDGTPWRALWFNTILGFFEAIIVEAWGQFIVNGEPDKVGQSDLLTAIKKIMRETINPELDERITQNTAGITSNLGLINENISAINYLQQIVDNQVEEAHDDGRFYGRINKTWMEITGGGGTIAGDAIEALKLYSKKSLMLTNARIIDRRKRGWDIGLPYLSGSSDVYHFDTDILNQNQQSNITINHSGDAPVLMGKDDYNGHIYFNPAVKEVAPYELKGRSLYGNFSITAQISGDNTTVEFWARLFQEQNVVMLRLGSAIDEIIFNIGGSDSEYSMAEDDNIPYSIPNPDDIPYSVAGINGVKVEYSIPDDDTISYSIPGDDDIPYSVESTNGGNNVQHIWQGGSESVSLDDEGVEIKENVWFHIAAVTTPETMSLFIGDKKIDFKKQSQTTQTMTLMVNEDEDEFNIDEFNIDEIVSCGIEAFSENTINRIPYAALNYQDKWFILEAQDVSKVKTNIFETEQFRNAVLSVINT